MSLNVGSRVRLETYTATIRYIGTVDGYGDQIWAGLEWDDTNRGKHDGVVKGKRYFETSHPTSGSLVKIQNVPIPTDLLTEIKSRYAEDDHGDNVIQLNQSSKKIELIGMEKTALRQSNIEKLINIVLDNRNVGFESIDTSVIFILCRELNLYGNLVYKWSTVKQIMKQFPRIHELNLRRNRMMKYEDDLELKGNDDRDEAFSESCKKLVISECSISEDTINPVLERFSNVTEVISFGNELTKFIVTQQVASRITTLDLEDNLLKSIDAIEGNYINLLHLSVARCSISCLDSFDGSTKFPKLETLNLRGNVINEWKSVNALRSLSNLTRLFFDCKNLTSEKGVHVYEVIIAKLSSLIDLNRFDVSEVERRSAEVRFINKYVLIKDESLKRDHVEDIQRLVKIHGEPSMDTAQKGLSLVKIRIECGNKVETKKLSLGMTVQKVTDILARLFKISSAPNIRLYLVMIDNNKQHRIELDNPIREFGHYSPSEDRDILVVEHD